MVTCPRLLALMALGVGASETWDMERRFGNGSTGSV